MIIDKEALLSAAQAITGSAASTDAVDLGASPVTRGMGDIVLAVLVGASFNQLTSLTVAVQSDEDSSFGTPRTVAQQTFLLAELVAKAQFTIALPLERVERYVRAYYTVTGTNPSAGSVTAWLASAGAL